MRIDTNVAEQQQQDSYVLPEGIYDFEVVTAEERRSQAGNDMIALKLRVYAKDGSPRYVFDYLLSKMFYKLQHFCEVTGLTKELDAQLLEAVDCIGKTGLCMLKIDHAEAPYKDKNSVKDYVKDIPAVKEDGKDTFISDDIPF